MQGGGNHDVDTRSRRGRENSSVMGRDAQTSRQLREGRGDAASGPTTSVGAQDDPIATSSLQRIEEVEDSTADGAPKHLTMFRRSTANKA